MLYFPHSLDVSMILFGNKTQWPFYLEPSLVAQSVKNLPARQEIQVQSLGLEDLLEKEMATHSSIPTWKILWTEEPGGLQSFYAAAAKSLQLCPTLCDPIDGSPPGSAVPGILQARTLEWVAIAFSNV